LCLVLAWPALALRRRDPDARRYLEDDGNETIWPHVGPDAYEQWRLYPFWHRPAKARAPLKNQSFLPGDPTDPVLVQCLGKNFKILQRYGYKVDDVSVPTLIPFVVPRGQHNRTDAAVVVVPGGGGLHLAFETEGTDVCKWFNSQGISAFLLKYRIPKDSWDTGAQIMDVQRAVSFVRSRAASLHLNESHVGLFGASHGGNLVLHAASLRTRLYPRLDKADDHSWVPNFNVLLYPATPEVFSHVQEPEVQALFNLSQLPPTFIASAADDKCVRLDGVLELYGLLQGGKGNTTQNNNTELHIYPNGGHAFALCYRRGLEWMQSHGVCMWTIKAMNFLQRTVLRTPNAAVSALYWTLRSKAIGVSKVSSQLDSSSTAKQP